MSWARKRDSKRIATDGWAELMKWNSDMKDGGGERERERVCVCVCLRWEEVEWGTMNLALGCRGLKAC